MKQNTTNVHCAGYNFRNSPHILKKF